MFCRFIFGGESGALGELHQKWALTRIFHRSGAIGPSTTLGISAAGPTPAKRLDLTRIFHSWRVVELLNRSTQTDASIAAAICFPPSRAAISSLVKA